jgi:dinuclear metal center YbgI/SA1388 family protein
MSLYGIAKQGKSMLLHALEKYTGQLLAADRFKDYAPNGVQVEGRAEVHRIATAVTASAAALDAAIEWGADALIVHHGWFWRGEDPRVIGIRRQRLARLLSTDMSLLAYHLPLDAHESLGNNAQLGRRLDLRAEGRFGDQDLGWFGTPNQDQTVAQFVARLMQALGRVPLVLGPTDRPIRRVGWCTGGAQCYFEAAMAAGCDLYLTGEVSEQHYHWAVEAGVTFVAAGHHATERFGVAALGEHLAEHFGLVWQHFELDNPV